MGETVYRLFAPNLMSICIDEMTDNDFRGQLWHQLDTTPIYFHGVTDLLFRMEELYDEWNFPQRSTNCRSFLRSEDTPDERSDNITKGKKEMSLHNIQDKRGKQGTFIVQVQYRQNSSWQGQVVWAEQNRKEHFRSALELLKLIDSAMNEEAGEEIKVETSVS